MQKTSNRKSIGQNPISSRQGSGATNNRQGGIPDGNWVGLEEPTKKQQRAEELKAELKRLEKVWTAVQATRRRNAIYKYLTELFDLVQRWKRLGRPKSLVRLTQEFDGDEENAKAEPYSVLIRATSNADCKMVSKLSRVLRYVEQFNMENECLEIFVIRRGGLNACAALFTEKLGSPRKKGRSGCGISVSPWIAAAKRVGG